MKVFIVWKDKHDESLVEKIFKNEAKAITYMKEYQKKADKYTCYYIDTWEIIE